MSTTEEARELTRDELREVLEERVRQEFDMTLAEFVTALDKGRLDADAPHVAGLAILVGARAS
jgi:hypothetical protein